MELVMGNGSTDIYKSSWKFEDFVGHPQNEYYYSYEYAHITLL